MKAVRVIRLLAGCALAAAMLPNAQAQNYPTRPVRIIAQFTPGTSTDILARLLGQKLNPTLYPRLPYDAIRGFAPIRAEIAKWGKAVKESGAKAD